MILCSILKKGLFKIVVTKSQIVTKFNVTKSRLHCTLDVLANLLSLPKPCLILDLGGLEIFLRISYSNLIVKYSKVESCLVLVPGKNYTACGRKNKKISKF